MITLYKIVAIPKPVQLFKPIINSPTEGSCGGTYFIDDSFVIKISETPSLDILSYNLAKLLSIPTPKMDVMTFSQFKCKHNYDFMVDKISDQQRISIQTKITAPSLTQIISNSETSRYESQLKNWHQLGRLLGFDLILDNEDRFKFNLEPFCGSSNFGNILINDSIIAIDLTPTKANKPEDYYIDKIYKLCKMFKLIKLELIHGTMALRQPDEIAEAHQLNQTILSFIASLPVSVSEEEKEIAVNIIKQSIYNILKNFIDTFENLPANSSNHYQYLTQLHTELSKTKQTNQIPNRSESPASVTLVSELYLEHESNSDDYGDY